MFVTIKNNEMKNSEKKLKCKIKVKIKIVEIEINYFPRVFSFVLTRFDCSFNEQL